MNGPVRELGSTAQGFYHLGFGIADFSNVRSLAQRAGNSWKLLRMNDEIAIEAVTRNAVLTFRSRVRLSGERTEKTNSRKREENALNE